MSRKTKRNGHDKQIAVEVAHSATGQVMIVFSRSTDKLVMNFEQAGNLGKLIFENAKAACAKSQPQPSIIVPPGIVPARMN